MPSSTSKVGRVGGFSEAIAVHNAAAERGIPFWCGGMLEMGIGRAHNIALSSLPNFSFPGDVSASSRYWSQDIIEPPVTVSKKGEILGPTVAGSGSRYSAIASRHRPFATKLYAPRLACLPEGISLRGQWGVH